MLSVAVAGEGGSVVADAGKVVVAVSSDSVDAGASDAVDAGAGDSVVAVAAEAVVVVVVIVDNNLAFSVGTEASVSVMYAGVDFGIVLDGRSSKENDGIESVREKPVSLKFISGKRLSGVVEARAGSPRPVNVVAGLVIGSAVVVVVGSGVVLAISGATVVSGTVVIVLVVVVVGGTIPPSGKDGKDDVELTWSTGAVAAGSSLPSSSSPTVASSVPLLLEVLLLSGRLGILKLSD